MKKTKNILAVMTMMLVSFNAFGGENAASPALPLPSSGNVTLPIAEYDKLLDLAKKPLPKLDTPPIAYSIQHADLKFKAGQKSVLGTVQLDGEVLDKGTTKVPLVSLMTIMDAHQQSKALPLQQEGSTATAILPGPSGFSVTLDAGLPLNIEAGRASFNLPAPMAGSVRLSLVIPGDHTNIRIAPGLITNRTSTNGQTSIEATLVPGQSANVSWTTRAVPTPAPQGPREARFLSDLKTLILVNEAEIRASVLADVTLVQGDPSTFSVLIPEGYEVTGASGATVDSSEIENGVLNIKVNQGTARSHQFFISMERPINGTAAEAPFVGFKSSQRETGEVLIEGTGALELTAKEGGGLQREDVREVNASLRALAPLPLQAAFRYHRQTGETPSLALEWTRFPDSPVLAAAAERAVVTTLVTSEGRSLTEVKLFIKNQAQPFLKVELPPGVDIVSAEVDGENVKPVRGADGSRVPLLRPGLRTTGVYAVSYVFMHSGAPFAKKGGSELDLPKMDIPINILQWEVFLPQQYQVKDFGGDAIPARFMAAADLYAQLNLNSNGPEYGVDAHDSGQADKHWIEDSRQLSDGQMEGTVEDPQGAVIAHAKVTLTNTGTRQRQTTTSDSSGHWVFFGLPSGKFKITVAAAGFRALDYSINYQQAKPISFSSTLPVSAAAETIEITGASAPVIQPEQVQQAGVINQAKASEAPETSDPSEKKSRNFSATADPLPGTQNQPQNAASSNVLNLQKRVAGVLPVRIDVPRAGNSYSFVRPLVLDEETRLTFSYKTK